MRVRVCMRVSVCARVCNPEIMGIDASNLMSMQKARGDGSDMPIQSNEATSMAFWWMSGLL